MRKLISFWLLISIIILINTQDVLKLQLEKPYQRQVNAQTEFTARYYFQIAQEQVKQMKAEQWFCFVQVQPTQEYQWAATSIELNIIPKKNVLEILNTSDHHFIYSKQIFQGSKGKKCAQINGGVDSCFLTNNQFNYKTQFIVATIKCKEKCKFMISGEIHSQYILTPRESLKLDFENTAYSKYFFLDTSKYQNLEIITNSTGQTRKLVPFDQLNIILRPETFLVFPAPISLYINKGKQLPTNKIYDYKGMTLWDNGLGVFIEKPDSVGQFTILVEGPEKNILLLQNQLISFTETNSLQKNLPFFDYLNVGRSKKYKLKINPSLGVIFQMSTFSGAIEMIKLYDEKLKQIDKSITPPSLFRTYGQLQYQLPAQFFNKNKQDYDISNYIIFQISGIKQSTFVLEYSDISNQISHLLPQRTSYVDISSNQANQYYIQFIELDDSKFKKVQFQIILTTQQIKGRPKGDNYMDIRFFGCKKQHGKDCQLRKSELQSTDVDNKDIFKIQQSLKEQIMNGVTIYQFKIQADKFIDYKSMKKFIFMVVIKNQSPKMQLYTLQYINYGKNIYLKENMVRKDRIEIDQNKYYVYTNLNNDVKEIRAHVMEISGRVISEGFYQDPRFTNNSNTQIVENYRNTITFKNVKQNQEIYIRVKGKDMAYYSVQLQFIKESQLDKSSTDKTKGYNEIVLAKDISYQFSLAPNSKEAYLIMSKDHQFLLQMSSSLPLQICLTQTMNKPPFSPHCDQKFQKFSTSKVLTTILEKGDTGLIGVTNNNEKQVKFHIKYYKQQKPIIIPKEDKQQNTTQPTKDQKLSDKATCFPALMGKIIKHQLKANLLYCVSYNLKVEKNEDIQLTIDVLNDKYQQVDVVTDINSIQRLEVIGSTHLFQKGQIIKDCKGKQEACPMKIFFISTIDTQLRFALQYLTQAFYLLDGIANSFSGYSEVRTFIYELYNKVDTVIMLENKRTNYVFYGRVVEANSYQAGNQVFPSKNNKIIQSSDPFYFNYQIAMLTQKQIKNSGCKECLLLLSVVKDKSINHDGRPGKFLIQCTQEIRNLNEGKPLIGYIQKKSMAFYQYNNQDNQSTIIVNIDSQNKKCASLYMKKGDDKRASKSSFDAKSSDSNLNTMILQKASAGVYSISLEAEDNCHYTIQVSVTADKQFSNLAKGKFKDIKLQKSNQKKFLYENFDNETIKLLTANQNGQVNINVKAYPNLKAFLDDKSKKIKYDWSGIDYIRIETTHPKFCVDCIYIFDISTQRSTSVYMMLTSKESQFPIQVDSVLRDDLKQDEIQKLRVFTSETSQYQVMVQYGSIQITIISSDDKEQQKTTYKKSIEAYKGNFKNTSKNVDGLGFMHYKKIQIKAINDSGYTFSLISDKDPTKRGNKIKLGVPEYFYLQKSKESCFYGVLDDEQQLFLISITGDKQQLLMNLLEVRCTADQKLLQLNKEIAKNQMIITIQKPLKTYPQKYQICLEINQPLLLTFIQSSKLNYLPEKNVTLVMNSMNFSFYSQGTSLIELNECRSRATAIISRSFNDITSINSQIQQVRKTNNIIEFKNIGPTFLNIHATTATISWRKKDKQTGEGTAYDDYSSNKIRIDKYDNFLNIQVYPPKKVIENPKIKLSNIKYKVFLAQEELQLYNAMNCNKGVYLQKQASSQVYDEDLFKTLSFSIESISSKFQKSKNVFIGVLVTAKSSLQIDGTYRFIYPYQQLPISFLQTGVQEQRPHINPIKPKPFNKDETTSSNFNSFVLYFTLAVIIVFLGIWVYRKFMKKFLKNRRRQKLAEQEVNYQQFTSYRP